MFLLVPQLFTGGDADHLFNKIKTGDQFGHRMFNLQAGIHFQKIEIAFGIDNKFNRSGTVIINRHCQPNGLLAHGLAGAGVQKRRWGFFDHLLIAPLDRAFAFVQMDAMAMLVSQHLNFNMPRAGDKFFNKYPVVAKT